MTFHPFEFKIFWVIKKFWLRVQFSRIIFNILVVLALAHHTEGGASVLMGGGGEATLRPLTVVTTVGAQGVTRQCPQDVDTLVTG